jgi:hypothetical protein
MVICIERESNGAVAEKILDELRMGAAAEGLDEAGRELTIG